MSREPPAFAWRGRVRVEVADPVAFGADVHGEQRVVPIVGGDVAGEWNGHVLPGGADWQTVLPDGSVTIDARYPVHLEGVGVVVLRARGARDATAPDDLFCTTLVVDGPDGSDVTASVYATVGRRTPGWVEYDVFEVSTGETCAGAPSSARFAPPVTEPVFTLHVDVEPPTPTETSSGGVAQLIPIVGGRVDGPGLSGVVLPGGHDCARDLPSGVFRVHARYHLRTVDGVTVSVENMGLWREEPGDQQPYFVTAPTFAAPDGAHGWLNRGVFVGLAVERGTRRIDIAVLELTPDRRAGHRVGTRPGADLPGTLPR